MVWLLLMASSWAQDFDFGESSDPVTTADSPVGGLVRFAGRRRVDGRQRWVDLGPSASLRFDESGRAGQLFGEGSIRVNGAYRLEGDPNAVVRRYEVEPQLRELYWRLPLGPTTWTVGDVVTSWGVADLLTVADRLNVTDHSRALFEDPVDTFSGQNTVRGDLYLGDQSFSLAVVPWPLFDRVMDGDHPASQTPGTRLRFDRDDLDWTPEIAGRWALDSGPFSVGLMGGYVRNRAPVVTALLDPSGLRLTRTHEHYAYGGLTATAAAAPVLLKAEVFYDHDRPVQAAPEWMLEAPPSVRQVSTVVGADLNLGRGGMVSVEGLGQLPMEPDDRLAEPDNRWQLAVAYSVPLYNDRLDLRAVGMWIEPSRGIVGRLDLGYDVTESWRVAARYTVFSFEDDEIPLDDDDRADLAIEYGF